MGICRDSRHKRRETGGRRKIHIKKRKFELGRPGANTKLTPGDKRVRVVRARGGNLKYRALRLENGNFSWGSENVSKKTRILGVVYNASNNELVRTNTLVKGCIVQIDAAPFKAWFEKTYATKIEENGKMVFVNPEEKKSKHALRDLKNRQKSRDVATSLVEQMNSGRFLAAISSRPGQSGRADGYLLEGKEYEFYQRQLNTKKGKKK
jgi:small subunit ribosomal protein S8e